MRFCQAFVSELFRHVGPDTDVPAGDIGVGGREVGLHRWHVQKLSNSAACVFTGKGLSFGGSLIRPEATGYGTVLLLRKRCSAPAAKSWQGKRVSVSGWGNVAQYAVGKAMATGAKVVTVSDSSGHGVRPRGFTPEESRPAYCNIKNEQATAAPSDYAAQRGGPACNPGRPSRPLVRPGGHRPALRQPQNELDLEARQAP